MWDVFSVPKSVLTSILVLYLDLTSYFFFAKGDKKKWGAKDNFKIFRQGEKISS